MWNKVLMVSALILSLSACSNIDPMEQPAINALLVYNGDLDQKKYGEEEFSFDLLGSARNAGQEVADLVPNTKNGDLILKALTINDLMLAIDICANSSYKKYEREPCLATMYNEAEGARDSQGLIFPINDPIRVMINTPNIDPVSIYNYLNELRQKHRVLLDAIRD